ncbi:hypothetical protein JZ751_017189, partial [Albula glossodonta]
PGAYRSRVPAKEARLGDLWVYSRAWLGKARRPLGSGSAHNRALMPLHALQVRRREDVTQPGRRGGHMLGPCVNTGREISSVWCLLSRCACSALVPQL